MSTPVKLGLFVPLIAKPSESAALQDFLLQGYTLAQDEHEPETIHWFAIKYTSALASPSTALTTQYLVFDTFVAESGRQFHLSGAIAAALMGKRDALLVEGDEGVAIKQIDILGNKVVKPAGAAGITKGLKCGLRVTLKAKADKVEDVKKHLVTVGTNILSEGHPHVWFGFWFPGTTEFGILGIFESEEAREERFNSPAAQAMRTNIDGLFEVPPDVVKVDILAAKV